MSLADDTQWMDATDQAELVRSGEVTPVELLEAALERIDRLDPDLNALTFRWFDEARAAAASPDLPDGPFRGVPFLLKDIGAAHAGEPFHQGSAFLKGAGHTARADAALVERFRAAGLVVLGRTNTPEFGTTITTEPAAYGPSHGADIGCTACHNSGEVGNVARMNLGPLTYKQAASHLRHKMLGDLSMPVERFVHNPAQPEQPIAVGTVVGWMKTINLLPDAIRIPLSKFWIDGARSESSGGRPVSSNLSGSVSGKRLMSATLPMQRQIRSGFSPIIE